MVLSEGGSPMPVVHAVSQTGTDLSVNGSMEGWELALILLVILAGLITITWPFIRSLARRLEPRQIDAETLARLDRLEGELHSVQALRERIAELEERVDF